MTTRSTIRTGFTFAEIMFAVMILGVGFIMVAAMFPVAIRQTQSTLEDLSGVAEAKRGEAIMRQLGASISGYNQNFTIANNTVPPFTNLVIPDASDPYRKDLHSFFETVATPGAGVFSPYDFVKGDIINQLDHRYAWIPIAYQADAQPTDAAIPGHPLTIDASGVVTINPTAITGATLNGANGQPLVAVSRILPQSARVWVVAVTKRAPTIYYVAGVSKSGGEYNNTDRDSGSEKQYNDASGLLSRDGCFRPKVTYFKVVEGEDPTGLNSDPDTLVFTDVNGNPIEELAADTGAYVWVASDRVAAAIPATTGINAMYAYNPGDANGRFYRLGSKLDSSTYGPGVWELQPGNDMSIKHNPGLDAFYGTSDDFYELENLPPRPYDSSHPYSSPNGGSAYNNSALTGPGGSLPARGFIIGKALQDPTKVYNASTNPYVGSAQDVYALPPVTITLKAQ